MTRDKNSEKQRELKNSIRQGWPGGTEVRFAFQQPRVCGSDPRHGPMHHFSSHTVAVIPHLKWREVGTDVRSEPVLPQQKDKDWSGCQLRANLPKKKKSTKPLDTTLLRSVHSSMQRWSSIHCTAAHHSIAQVHIFYSTSLLLIAVQDFPVFGYYTWCFNEFSYACIFPQFC